MPNSKILTLGDIGRYPIGDTVQLPVGVTVTCDQELAKRRSSGPRDASERDEGALDEALQRLTVELDLLSSGGFAKHMASAERALASGAKHYASNPLASAIALLQRGNAKKAHTVDDAWIASFALFRGVEHVLDRWRNHPKIAQLTKDLCNSPLHTMVQLLFASYLWDNDVNVAMNPLSTSRSADMYFRLTADERLYLEVKVPDAFQWPNKLATVDAKKVIKKQLQKVQINREKPGVLAIGCSAFDKGSASSLYNAAQAVLRQRGKVNTGVAAIAVITVDRYAINIQEAKHIRFQARYDVNLVLNPHYHKKNPIIVGKANAAGYASRR